MACWKVVHHRGDRLRFTDRTCANFMSALVQVGGQLVESNLLGKQELTPQAKRFFQATVKLSVEKKEEFESMSGLKLKSTEQPQLVG